MVRCTRSSSALLVAVALFSSVRASLSWVSASLRNLPRVSSILLSTSLIAASARGMARAVESIWPRFSTSARRRRSTSTWEIAPWATSGSDIAISWRSNCRLLAYWARLELNSRSSCCFCTSCCCRPPSSSCSCWRRLWYSDCSLAAWLGAALRSSSSICSGLSSTSAVRRCTRKAMARREASVSSTLEAKRVSSRRSSGWPTSTISPSLAKISATMPPSRFWIFCTLDDGMALPSPRVTSSMGATLAQMIRNRKNAITPQMVRRTTRGASSINALLTSGSGWPASDSEPLK